MCDAKSQFPNRPLAVVHDNPHQSTHPRPDHRRDRNDGKNRFMKYLSPLAGLLFLSTTLLGAEPAATEYDIVVYGGTSGGVVAAVQAAKMGKSVLLIEPGRHLGGLTAGGLGATDIGNKAAIGGLSREFYRKLGAHYARPEAWTWQKRDEYRSRRKGNATEMWTFEPHVAEQTYRDWLAEYHIPVRFEERLDLKQGVVKTGPHIEAIVMESGLRVTGRVFIDATYEGDLMAVAGVSYHVGRESNATYGATINGVQTKNALYHQFIKPVDPYVKPGDPASGLLPGIRQDGPGEEGAGDRGVQAYCFRMCTTDVPENRVSWTKPKDYDPLKYELLLRNFDAGDHRVPWHPTPMPNRKTDVNNNYAVSTDYIGANYDYPEADYDRRAEIIQAHLSYQQGLMWTLANDPRVPEEIRREFQTWGLAKDEFVETDHWPHQLYIREARRMISDYVMSEKNCIGTRTADDAVGLAAYTMDSHNIQRYVRDGRVLNEGDVQVGGFSPYPIAYRSIRPKEGECDNLLVPVALSASHIAYGSIRMEPVFMVLGQSAATAACQAIDQRVSVQRIDYAAFKQQLQADGQVLVWTGPRRKPPIDAASLPGIVVDDLDAKVTGIWKPSKSVDDFVGTAYRHDQDQRNGELSAEFRPQIPEAGWYEVRIAYTPSSNRADNVPVTVHSTDGTKTIKVNQKKKPDHGAFHAIGRFRFEKGTKGRVVISNRDTNGYVVIDAVQFLPVKDPESK